MELSTRLKTIADFVHKDEIIADIGTDHGYIPIYLVLSGICSLAYASDIKKGPLKRAEANIKRYGVEGKVIPLLSDGLKAFDHIELDAIIIAGMGGMLICDILREKKELLKGVKHLILSPHLDIGRVRRTLHQLGFKIDHEAVVKEEDKDYFIISSSQGIEVYSEIEYEYSKLLLDKRDQVYWDYLKRLKLEKHSLLGRLMDMKTQNANKRRKDLMVELSQLDEVMKWYM